MPTPANGSTKIALVDSRIIANLCDGKFYVDASPTVYIGSGKDTVLGANVQITNPYGVVVKPYGSNYEISPSLSGGMDAQIVFNIPTQAANFQYGTYKVELKMFDDTGSWVVEKTVNICAPDKNNKNRNYGSLSAQLKGVCKDGKLYVIVDTVPTYKGKVAESQEQEFTLLYPTVSEKDPTVTSLGQFTVLLFEGEYKITGEICATYNLGENVFVNVKYKVKKQKNIRCQLDVCCVLNALVALNSQINSDCTDEEKNKTASITVDALRLLRMAELSGECGEDASEYIEQLEDLLGCKCTCNCLEGAPIVPSAEGSTDIRVEGCNVEESEAGLTKVYTINNYEYVVDIAQNGGALIVASATLANCTKTQLITFDISVVYAQIKTLANTNNTEADFWGGIVNKSLRDVDPACLGINSAAWQALTIKEKVEAILNKFCACCSCDAEVELDNVEQQGGNVKITWTESGSVFSVDVYIDDAFAGNVLAGVKEFIFASLADGAKHTYKLIAKCDDGKQTSPVTDDFEYLGCPEIVPPTFAGDRAVTAPCPYDLTALVLTLPVGTTVEWRNVYGVVISNPAEVIGGTYYAFSKDADGCYSSSGMAFEVTCEEGASSCTAPQNLEVINFGGMSHLVRFQSAAYPPPGNSYTVRRRLFSDPDVSGSYTTLGSATYDVGMARWIFNDTTALDNVLYVYVVQSNCGGSPGTTPSTAGTKYLNLVCNVPTLTPHETSVDYSFVPFGGTIDKYEVEIYDATNATLLHTDTFLPSFSNPITGVFNYLTSGTQYNVSIKAFSQGAYSNNCLFYEVETLPSV